MHRNTRFALAAAFALSAFAAQAGESFQALNNHVRLFVGANSYSQLSDSHTDDYTSKDSGTFGAVSGALRLQGSVGAVRGVFGEVSFFTSQGDSKYSMNAVLTGNQGTYGDVPAQQKGWQLKLGKSLPLGGAQEQFTAYALVGKQTWSRDARSTPSALHSEVTHDILGLGVLTQVRLSKTWSVELDLAAAKTRNIRMLLDGSDFTAVRYKPNTQTLVNVAAVQELDRGWALRYTLDYMHARLGESDVFELAGEQYVLPRSNIKTVSYGVAATKSF